jgi:V/A-type H+-transporting ATPase subunit B
MSSQARSLPARETLSLVSLRGVDRLSGPILTIRGAGRMAIGDELVIRDEDGRARHGQVLELDGDTAAVQVYEGTVGLTLEGTRVELGSGALRLGVSAAMLGRVMNGRGEPIDDGPAIVPVRTRRVDGEPINPAARANPSDFIETGFSAIDLLDSLVRGQKLPIFTGAGLPASELAARIATGARVRGDERFATIFAALGITHREADFFRDAFESSGARDRVALFLNLADDPAMERLLTPRCALTLAEHLAFDLGMEVLVIITDVTNYGEALRELATAREEMPGRRGYPGYLYTDLARLFERAGRIRDRAGSLTVLPIVTMPDDDITHPIPDLTGYITEGQIVLGRGLHGQGVFPPIDALPCLSRVMNAGIGEGKTRAEHRAVADQLYALYARGRELRNLVAVIGEAALSEAERRVLAFAERFERELVHQGLERRTLDDSFAIAWRLLGTIPRDELVRIPTGVLDRWWQETPS